VVLVVVAVVVGALAFVPLGVAASALVPNEEAAGPMLSIAFFVLLFISGLWFPLQPHSVLAEISGWFPFRRLMLAMQAPFLTASGLQVSPWSWRNLGVVMIFGVASAAVAVRLFRFEPHRA
jgi:ABC-2 type transport system permease protein